MSSLGTRTHDHLIAGDFPLVTESNTIVSGAGALTRGTLLGKITASGKLQTCDSTASDGSETAYAILAEDADAASADAVATVYLTGQFNEDAITFGGTDTIATHRAALRALCIFARSPVSE